MTLLEFLSIFGINKTTNFDLMDICKSLNLDVKILMSDEIKNAKELNIINYQSSKDQGSHWCCFCKSKRFYFDSYGVIPPKEIFEYFQNDFTYNTLQIQDESLKCCGQLCCFVLFKSSLGVNFENIVLDMYNKIKNI